MSGNGQIPTAQVAGLEAAIAAGASAAIAVQPRVQPLAATDGSGNPSVVFDESGQLVMVEVPN